MLQDTNVVLWEKMHTYEPGTAFKTWAFTVARNKVMQYWDKQKRQNRIALSEKTILAVAEARKSDTPEHIEDKLAALTQHGWLIDSSATICSVARWRIVKQDKTTQKTSSNSLNGLQPNQTANPTLSNYAGLKDSYAPNAPVGTLGKQESPFGIVESVNIRHR